MIRFHAKDSVSPLYSVYFPDNNHGYAVSARSIVNILDGGINWAKQTLGTKYYLGSFILLT